MQKGESSAVSLWMAIKLETELLFPRSDTKKGPQKNQLDSLRAKITQMFFFPKQCPTIWVWVQIGSPSSIIKPGGPQSRRPSHGGFGKIHERNEICSIAATRIALYHYYYDIIITILIILFIWLLLLFIPDDNYYDFSPWSWRLIQIISNSWWLWPMTILSFSHDWELGHTFFLIPTELLPWWIIHW